MLFDTEQVVKENFSENIGAAMGLTFMCVGAGLGLATVFEAV